MRRPRVFLVDDFPIVLEGLAALLSSEGGYDVCGTARDAKTAAREIERLRPDLVIVDIVLPGESGLELVRRFRGRPAEPRFLVMSMHEESIYAARAVRAGAHGYICKSASNDALLAAVAKTLKGRISVSPRVVERLIDSWVSGQEGGEDDWRSLSNREMEIFERIGEGLGTAEIARRLRRSVKTVETHRRNIMKKLGLKKATELVWRAIEHFHRTRGTPVKTNP